MRTPTQLLILSIGILGCNGILTPSAQATTWGYSWDVALDGFNNNGGNPSAPAGGSNDGGIWKSMNFTDDDVSHILTGSITMDISQDVTDALWIAITNGPTPSGLGNDYAALYLYDGTITVTPDHYDPTSSHPVGPVIATETYSVSTSGNEKTFSFSFNTDQINNYAGGPGWKGISFPYDAQNNTAGNAFDPYRFGAWIRSFADGAATMDADQWTVHWGPEGDYNVGTWDIDGVNVSPVPEPSGTVLLLAVGMAGFLRRKRSN